MSGHSKWANIKRGKALNDAKKSAVFTKISRLITVAARNGADPISNSALRLAIEKAKEARMPKDNIDRAIQKGSGASSSLNYFEVVYEGYGPGGVAFFITAITDNKNRTVAEIRSIFSKAGGSLGGTGSTAYIFANEPQNPSFEVDIEDEKLATTLIKLVEHLEDHDDISEVYFNANIADKFINLL